jgi:hypothetical protein
MALFSRRWIGAQSGNAIFRLSASVLLATGILPAQEIKIWSEFQRIDPFGEVVAIDRVDDPREILSPAVARNAWASFHLALRIAENTPSFLYIQQNPELFQVTVYKEYFTKTAHGWIPDRLSVLTPVSKVDVDSLAGTINSSSIRLRTSADISDETRS